MAERVLVFDVETTGLPVRRNRPYTETANFPQVVQLAHRINAEPVANVYLQTRADIPPEAVGVHGVTNEFLAENGVDPKGALEAFLTLVGESDVLVAHNFEFDSSVILAQAHGLGLDVRPLRDHPRCVCTMMESTPVLRLRAAGRRRWGGFKWPKLAECVAFYGLPVDPAGLHDARQDVLATSLVYEALRKAGP